MGSLLRRCEVCKHGFTTKPSQVKRGFGRYCSRHCMMVARAANKPDSRNGGWQYQTHTLEQRAACYPTDSWWAYGDARFCREEAAAAVRMHALGSSRVPRTEYD